MGDNRPKSHSDAHAVAAGTTASLTDDPPKASSLVDIIAQLEDFDLTETSNPALIDTAEALSDMVGLLQGLPTEPPSLYVNLEEPILPRHHLNSPTSGLTN